MPPKPIWDDLPPATKVLLYLQTLKEVNLWAATSTGVEDFTQKGMSVTLGMSVPSVGRWLDILETNAQVVVVPPFYENVGKRIIKSPRVYIADSGLACHLLGIRSAAELDRSPFAGALFEGFVASEIVKAQLNAGRRKELYYFRDQQGLEVDFVVPGGSGSVHLIEAKSTTTPTPGMASPMLRFAAAWEKRGHPRRTLSMTLVHRPRGSARASHVLCPGVQAIPWAEYFAGKHTPK